jgi:hypothetical protein
MNKHYITFDDLGNITGQGNAQISMIDYWSKTDNIITVEDPLDDVTKYHIVNGQVESRTTPLIIEDPYHVSRTKSYNVGEQLDLLYKDIDAGLFGAKAKTSSFYSYIKAIKEQYPKP